MTDQEEGTAAYADSLRPPGEQFPGESTEATDDDIAADAAPRGDDPVVDRGDEDVEGRAGYDVGAVSGDSEIYRPD